MNHNKFSNEAVAFGELELDLIKESPQQWVQRITTQTSLNQFNKLMLALVRHATFKEIRQFLETSKNYDHREFKVSQIIANQMSDWKDKLKRFEPKVFLSEKSYRKTIRKGYNHWLIHYKYQSDENQAATIHPTRPTIIGVPGNGGCLMMPTACFLAAISESKQDLVLVRKCKKESYFNDNYALLEEIRSNLVEVLETSSSQLITFGSSSGGLAAICLGTMLGVDSCIAIGPGIPKENIHKIRKFFANYRTELTQAKTKKTKFVLCAASGHKKDIKNLIQIHKNLTGDLYDLEPCNIFLFKNASTHGFLVEIANQGVTLSDSLNAMLCSSSERKGFFDDIIVDLVRTNDLHKHL